MIPLLSRGNDPAGELFRVKKFEAEKIFDFSVKTTGHTGKYMLK